MFYRPLPGAGGGSSSGAPDLSVDGLEVGYFPVGPYLDVNESPGYIDLQTVQTRRFGGSLVGLVLDVTDDESGALLFSAVVAENDIQMSVADFFHYRTGGHIRYDYEAAYTREKMAIGLLPTDADKRLRLTGSFIEALIYDWPAQLVFGKRAYSAGNAKDAFHAPTNQSVEATIENIRGNQTPKFFVREVQAIVQTIVPTYGNETVAEIFPNGVFGFGLTTTDGYYLGVYLDPAENFLEAMQTLFVGTPFEIAHNGYAYVIHVDGGKGPLGVDVPNYNNKIAFSEIFYTPDQSLSGILVVPKVGGDFTATSDQIYVKFPDPYGPNPDADFGPLPDVLDRIRNQYDGRVVAASVYIPLPGADPQNLPAATLATLGVTGPVDFTITLAGGTAHSVSVPAGDSIMDSLQAAFTAIGIPYQVYWFPGLTDTLGFPAFRLDELATQSVTSYTPIASIAVGWLPQPLQSFALAVGPGKLDAEQVSINTGNGVASLASEIARLRSAVQYLLSNIPEA